MITHWKLTKTLLTASPSWCDTSFLELNVSKTKELVIDPRRGDHPAEPVKVNGQSVEVVDSFKYLGLTLDSKLSFCQHITSTQRKGQQRLYVPRTLKSFHLRPKHLSTHHRTHSYLLHHDLSFVSFSLREKQALENCKHSINNYWPSSSFRFQNHRTCSSPQGTFGLC